MNLVILFIIHGLITLAAGIVLIAAPEVIPETVGISIPPDSYLICYLLGTAEIALACLSFFGAQLTDRKALKLISVTFVVFHFLTAVIEVYAYARGVKSGILVNVAFRILICLLFLYYGVIANTGPVQQKKNGK